MMIKYRVREVAKDLDIQNKEIIDTLEKYFPEPKKYMTALTEEELDVVFDTFTQARNMESLDEYFAQREKAAVQEEPAPAAEEKPAPSKEENPAPQVPEKKAEKQPEKAAAKKEPAPVQDKEPKQPVRRVVDTRSSNVNIDQIGRAHV